MERIAKDFTGFRGWFVVHSGLEVCAGVQILIPLPKKPAARPGLGALEIAEGLDDFDGRSRHIRRVAYDQGNRGRVRL